MPDTVRTCLWFEDRAEEAAAFYTSLVSGSEITGVQRPAPDAPPILIHFTLAGVPYSILQARGGPAQSHAASISITLETQEKTDEVYDRILAAGGTEVQCGWVTDPWGVSWQVIPAGFTDVLMGGDAEANQRAFEAMQAMKRLDLAALRRAAAGEALSA